MSDMTLDDFFPRKPFRPAFNLGCLHDVITGEYMEGVRGESILVGGMRAMTGISGRGNVFKSVYMHWMNLTILDRYSSSKLSVYDTETSATTHRFEQLAYRMSNLKDVSLEDSGRFILTDSAQLTGNKWYEQFKKMVKVRETLPKEQLITTPIIDTRTQQSAKVLYPVMVEMDSLSGFTTESMEEFMDKKEIGDGGLQTYGLKQAGVKNQMYIQLPNQTAAAGILFSFTAHVGDQHQLDPYAPPKKQLQYLKQGLKLKDVPEKASFYNNAFYFVTNAVPLQNRSTKAPEFPSSPDDDLSGDTDLVLMSVIILRSKNGPSGIPFELIASQREGIMVGLSEFWYCKCYGRFGIGGNDRNYYMELYPECSLSRTTIRGKIDQDPLLRRAMTITSELCQMRNHWDDREELWCDPATLYKDLKEQGYDWNTLLNTRGYWLPLEQEEGELPFLSTQDLLRMRKGLYRPYWMESTDQKS